MSGKRGSAVANPYRTVRQEGEHYMVIYFVPGEGINNDKAVPVLYRQVDTVAYTEDQMRPYIDRVDYPLVEDPQVSGMWSVVDFVRRAENFSPDRLQTPKRHLAITNLQFLPRGICIKYTRSEANGKKMSWALNYTKGLVLNRTDMTAEEYVIKAFDGKEYLLVQHKSGDYAYGGIEPYWYVFERKDEGK